MNNDRTSHKTTHTLAHLLITSHSGKFCCHH